MLKLLKKKIPESIHECPFTDSQLQANNLTLSKEDFRILSAGKYKVICTLSDEYDYKILKMITHVTIWIKKKEFLALWAPLCWILDYSLRNFMSRLANSQSHINAN